MISNVGTPTQPQHVATKEYVDAEIASNSLSTPPICSGDNKALGWTGSNWVCNTIQASGGGGGGGSNIITVCAMSCPSGCLLIGNAGSCTTNQDNLICAC